MYVRGSGKTRNGFRLEKVGRERRKVNFITLDYEQRRGGTKKKKRAVRQEDFFNMLEIPFLLSSLSLF